MVAVQLMENIVSLNSELLPTKAGKGWLQYWWP